MQLQVLLQLIAVNTHAGQAGLQAPRLRTTLAGLTVGTLLGPDTAMAERDQPAAGPEAHAAALSAMQAFKLRVHANCAAAHYQTGIDWRHHLCRALTLPWQSESSQLLGWRRTQRPHRPCRLLCGQAKQTERQGTLRLAETDLTTFAGPRHWHGRT